MQNQEVFLKLLSELEALKKTIAANTDYQSLRFSFEDIIGFLDDKLLHVFMKYDGVKPYEGLKALAITSLINVKSRLYRKYGREVSLGDYDVPSPEDEGDFTKQLDHLQESLARLLTREDAFIANMIISPPLYILDKVKDPTKRIPSHLFLEYMELPTDKQSVKHFNSCRRRLISIIRERVNPVTFDIL